jgi:hypothetical protein
LYEQVDDEPAQWRVFFGAIFEVVGENNSFSTKALMGLISGDFESFFKGRNGKNCSFSPESLKERTSGELKGFSEYEENLGGNSENNSLKSALPDSLGDPGDKGFSRRLGLAMRKRKDQIFEIGEGFIQLKEDLPDRHRQKPQWKLISVKNTPSAPIAPSCGNHYIAEKIIPETCQGNQERIIFSPMEGAAEQGVEGVLGVKDEPFVFKDDPEERAAIQNESPRDGGTPDGETQVE